MSVHKSICILNNNLSIIRRGIATTSQLSHCNDIRERSHPISGKNPVVKDIKDAFDLVKSG